MAPPHKRRVPLGVDTSVDGCPTMTGECNLAEVSRVTEIIADVLNVPVESIGVNSGPRDFAQWDSAAHIDIVLSLEAEYGVSFSAEEMVEMLSAAALEQCLQEKLK
jgi:acyl carrier protein